MDKALFERVSRTWHGQMKPLPRISIPEEATAEVMASEAVQFSLEFEGVSEKID
ncbi:MAG: hypothetical protein LAP61_05810 [Acidobacteriia bacterium]|nr:hypothetical protein [Terriglobia bacterium]